MISHVKKYSGLVPFVAVLLLLVFSAFAPAAEPVQESAPGEMLAMVPMRTDTPEKKGQSDAPLPRKDAIFPNHVGESPGGDVIPEDTDDPVVPDQLPQESFILLEKEPAPLNLEAFKKRVGYPKMAQEAEISGSVILRLQVNAAGKVEKHIVLRSAHPIFTHAVRKELPRLNFSPGISEGKAVMVWTTIRLDFPFEEE